MLILASASEIRQTLLRNAAVAFEAVPVRVDEAAITEALLAEGASPRDVADALAEMKASRVRRAGLVLGCDQVLDHDGALVGKPATQEAATAQLLRMAAGRHRLHSAAVIFEDGRPVWRHVATVTMAMRPLSAGYVAGYVARNWDVVRHCAGGYALEGESARLFAEVHGDHFAVLGLPLLPLIDFLVARGEIET